MIITYIKEEIFMIITKGRINRYWGRPTINYTFEEGDDIAAMEYGYHQNEYEDYDWLAHPYQYLFLQGTKGSNIRFDVTDSMIEYKDGGIHIHFSYNRLYTIIIPMKFIDKIHWERTYRSDPETEVRCIGEDLSIKEDERTAIYRNLYSNLQANFLVRIASTILTTEEEIKTEDVIHFLEYVKEVLEREIPLLESVLRLGETYVNNVLIYEIPSEEIDRYRNRVSYYKNTINKIVDKIEDNNK